MRRAPTLACSFAVAAFVAFSAPSPMVRAAHAGAVVKTEMTVSDISPAPGENITVCVYLYYEVASTDLGASKSIKLELKENDLSPLIKDNAVADITASFTVPLSAHAGDIIKFGPFCFSLFNPANYDPSIFDPEFYVTFDDGTTIFKKCTSTIEVEPRPSNPSGTATPKTEVDIVANVSPSTGALALYGAQQQWDVPLGQTHLVSVTAKNNEATNQNVRLRSRFVLNDEGSDHGYALAPAETVLTGVPAGGTQGFSFRLTRTSSNTGFAVLEAALVSDTTKKDPHPLALGPAADLPVMPMSSWPLASLMAITIGGAGIFFGMRSLRRASRAA